MVSMQGNMQVHDDLAALFSRNLNFNPEVESLAQKELPRAIPEERPYGGQPIVYSTSQHYTHSAHVVKLPTQAGSEQEELRRPSSEPPQSDTSSAEHILRLHGVDPSNLTPSQLELFRIAETPQQMRLLELWSICPPKRTADIPSLAWSSTTMEQEEQMAQLRLERFQHDPAMSSVQQDESRWVQQLPQANSEPYMASGYEELMRREREAQARESGMTSFYGNNYTHATDPVYLGPDYAREQQQLGMASQYGAFEQFRETSEVDAMDVM